MRVFPLQTGPFIDSAHPLIVRGEVDELPTAMFRHRISSKLTSLVAASPRTAVLLIPNGRDLVNPHAAFPQAPFVKDPELGLGKVRATRLRWLRNLAQTWASADSIVVCPFRTFACCPTPPCSASTKCRSPSLLSTSCGPSNRKNSSGKRRMWNRPNLARKTRSQKMSWRGPVGSSCGIAGESLPRV